MLLGTEIIDSQTYYLYPRVLPNLVRGKARASARRGASNTELENLSAGPNSSNPEPNLVYQGRSSAPHELFFELCRPPSRTVRASRHNGPELARYNLSAVLLMSLLPGEAACGQIPEPRGLM